MLHITFLKYIHIDIYSFTFIVHSTTRKPKFGFAWLFSNSGSEKESDTLKNKKPKKKLDQRIEATNLEIEGSIGESRVTVYSSNVKPWNVRPNKKFCTSNDMIDWDGLSRLEAEEGDTIILKCMLHDVHHEVDFDNFKISWSVVEKKSNQKIKNKKSSSGNSKVKLQNSEANGTICILSIQVKPLV